MKRFSTAFAALAVCFFVSVASEKIEVTTPPVMESVERLTDTSLRLYFNEPVQLSGAYNSDFSMTDCQGNFFGVTALNDNVAGDNWIDLTTDDLSSAKGDLNLIFFNISGPVLDLDGNALDTDGIGLFVLHPTKFDVSQSVYENKFFNITENSDPRAFTFNNDGTKIYVLGINTDATVYEYTLSTPYEVQTMSPTGVTLSVGQSGSVTSPLHIRFTPDGSKLFVG